MTGKLSLDELKCHLTENLVHLYKQDWKNNFEKKKHQ